MRSRTREEHLLVHTAPVSFWGTIPPLPHVSSTLFHCLCFPQGLIILKQEHTMQAEISIER